MINLIHQITKFTPTLQNLKEKFNMYRVLNNKCRSCNKNDKVKKLTEIRETIELIKIAEIARLILFQENSEILRTLIIIRF